MAATRTDVQQPGERSQERLPSNITRCERCYARVQKKRLEKHYTLPECLVPIAMAEMRDAGWERAPGYIYDLAKDAGFATKMAPIAWTRVAFPTGGEPKNAHYVQSHTTLDVSSNGTATSSGWWAPAKAVAAIKRLAGLPMLRARRIELVKRMVAEPDFALAIDTLFRLNPTGKIPKEW